MFANSAMFAKELKKVGETADAAALEAEGRRLLEEAKTAPSGVQILETGEYVVDPAPGSRVDLQNQGNRLLEQARVLRLAEAEKRESPPAESQGTTTTWVDNEPDISRDNPQLLAEPPPDDPRPRALKPAHAPSTKPKYREVFQ